MWIGLALASVLAAGGGAVAIDQITGDDYEVEPIKYTPAQKSNMKAPVKQQEKKPEIEKETPPPRNTPPQGKDNDDEMDKYVEVRFA